MNQISEPEVNFIEDSTKCGFNTDNKTIESIKN